MYTENHPIPTLATLALGACLALAPLALGACNEASPFPCGLAECEDGITVQVTNIARDTRYDVVITTPDETRECSIDTTQPDSTLVDCADPPTSWPEVTELEFIYRQLPETLTISVSVPDSDLTVEETFTPPYMEFAPNGRDCGPICVKASVELALP